MKKKILMLLCVILLVGTFAGCTDTEDTSKSESKPKKEATKKVVVDNDFIKATYLGVKKEYGLVTLNFKFENKTNKEITVQTTGGSIDDTMLSEISGISADMQPKKNCQKEWMIDKVPKKKVEFKLKVLNKQFDTISQTKTIKIKM